MFLAAFVSASYPHSLINSTSHLPCVSIYSPVVPFCFVRSLDPVSFAYFHILDINLSQVSHKNKFNGQYSVSNTNNTIIYNALLYDKASYSLLYHAICYNTDWLTIGPLPQPCAVQACSLTTCRLQGESPSTKKNLWEELVFKMRTPSSQRP